MNAVNKLTYFPTLRSTTPEDISWETMVTTIRGDYLREKTEMYRRAAAESDKALMTRIKQSCPGIVCQAVLEGGRGKENIRAYTGTFMADFDHVPADKMALAIKFIHADKHTRVCYTTISGSGLRVIASVEGEVTEKNYDAAWLTVNEHYKKLIDLDYDAQCKSNTRVCGLAWDPHVFFNPLAKRLKINYTLDTKSARKGKGAGRPPKPSSVEEDVKKFVDDQGITYTEGYRNKYVSSCIYEMNRYGVSQAACIQWAKETFEDYDSTHKGNIEDIVRNIYLKHAEEHNTLSASKSRRATVAEVENYIKERYVIRRNLLSFQLEFQQKTQAEKIKELKNERIKVVTDDSSFKTVDDHFVNSLWRNMQNDGVNTDTQTINNILGSDFVTDYHPFISWLNTLPEWDGTTDHIHQFFSMVHCKDTSEEDFHFYTRCWFMAMVASVLDPKVVNHQILTLIGAQGTYKSSFMLHILPPHLREYYTTKNNTYQINRDDSFMLAENILISLEEIDSMTTKEVNQLKAFTTQPKVKERPFYGRHKMHLPRVASLCATGNNPSFLTDMTGNRRWLPFVIEHIDDPWTANIPYEGMYAQALALIRSGERYWLNDTEIQRLNERNRDFLTPDPATELIITFYTIPRTESETKYLTASKIAARFAPYLKVSPTKIGIALSELGYEQVRTKKGRFWKVAERPANEIDSRLPDDVPEPMPF